jgi:hypothetical protein
MFPAGLKRSQIRPEPDPLLVMNRGVLIVDFVEVAFDLEKNRLQLTLYR